MITKRARRSKKIPTIFTIGHSTRPIAEFLTLLQEVGVDLLVDVRSIPRSRTNSQFNVDALPGPLGDAGIRYRHISALGGLRHWKKGATSLNTFWHVAAFRNYADYAATDAFRNRACSRGSNKGAGQAARSIHFISLCWFVLFILAGPALHAQKSGQSGVV